MQSILVDPSESHQTSETQQLRFNVGLKPFEVNYSSSFQAFDPNGIKFLPSFDVEANICFPAYGYKMPGNENAIF